MSGIRSDEALGRTVRKRDTVSLERFNSRIGYERAELLLTNLRHFCYEFICACNLIMRDSWIDEVHMSASWLSVVYFFLTCLV